MEDNKEITEEKVDEMRFISLIGMLSQGVMHHLGKMANPLTGKCERNLEAAAATIDLIQMLKRKTVGNLSEEESKILGSTLANLQLNYVDELEKGKTKPQGEEGREGEGV